MDAPEPTRDAAALAAYLDEGRPRREREAAFREVVDRHARRVHAVCLRILGSHADAEDATQETFVRLARSAGDLRGDAALSTWLFRVAHNVCTDRVRYEARRPRTLVADVTSVADEASPAAGPDSDARLEADEVGRALRRLDERSRTLLLLVAVEGLSYAEAAAATGLAVGTVKSRVARARVRLGELLAAAEAGDATGSPTDGGPGSPDVRRPRPRGPP